MARLASAAKWQEWEERLARFERAGLPIWQFCEAEGVNPGTFWYWRRNLMGSAMRRTPKAGQFLAFNKVERHWACGPRDPLQGSRAATGR